MTMIPPGEGHLSHTLVLIMKPVSYDEHSTDIMQLSITLIIFFLISASCTCFICLLATERAYQISELYALFSISFAAFRYIVWQYSQSLGHVQCLKQQFSQDFHSGPHLEAR